MVAPAKLFLSDISRQKKYEARIGDDGLTADHSVGQAIEHYLDRVGIRDHSLRWTAFSRGVKLDSKSRLADVPETDANWTVLPETHAG
jgi:hypothetical protein